MKQTITIVTTALVLGLFACKGKSNETPAAEKEKTETESATAQESTTSSAESSDPYMAKWEARKAKGDTIALPYKTLQTYLPEISGYTKEGGPSGNQMNMPGMGSYSQTEQEYVNGEKRIHVQILDYNSAMQAMQGVMMAYGMGFSSEDDNKKQEQVNLGVKDVAAYQTIYKTEKRAEIIVAIAARFFLEIKVTGDNDPATLQSVVKSVPLDKLAAL